MDSRRSKTTKWMTLTATASLTMAVIGTTPGLTSQIRAPDHPLAIHGPGTPQIQQFGNEPPWPIARNEAPTTEADETWIIVGHLSLFGVTVWVDSLRVSIPNLLLKPWLPSDLLTMAWYLQFGAGIRTGCPIPETRVASDSRLKLLTDPNDLPHSFPTIDLGLERATTTASSAPTSFDLNLPISPQSPTPSTPLTVDETSVGMKTVDPGFFQSIPKLSVPTSVPKELWMKPMSIPDVLPSSLPPEPAASENSRRPKSCDSAALAEVNINKKRRRIAAVGKLDWVRFGKSVNRGVCQDG